MAETWELAAAEIARRVQRGELRATEALASAVARAHAVDGAVRAFVRRDLDGAERAAADLDHRIARGERAGTLAGVPVAIKDNLSVAGWPLTCGSRVLDGYRAPYTATVVERLRAADAIVVGQTNMDEFAMGSSCENSSFFATRNPWRLDRVPGGSSGGSAAAVASGSASLALGSDTGGSVRQPAALCGAVGLKPTYGRISRYGLVAFASSFDQIGPISSTVEDAALALGVLAGPDSRDSTCAERPPDDYLSGLERGIAGLRVGVLRELEGDLGQLPADVAEAWHAGLARLESAGASVVEVSVPAIQAAVAVYYVVANCEASTNLARFDGVRYGYRSPDHRDLDELYRKSRSEGFGREVKRRIMLGTFALSSGYYQAYYGRAVSVMRRMRAELMTAFAAVDLIATPTIPTAAFRIGEKVSDPLAMYLSDVYTTPASLAGLPALAVPSGLDRSGLPLSLQLMARPFEEALLLRAGRAFERARGSFGRPTLAEVA